MTIVRIAGSRLSAHPRSIDTLPQVDIKSAPNDNDGVRITQIIVWYAALILRSKDSGSRRT